MYGRLLVVAMCPLALAACETTGSTVATAGAAGALYAARSPGSEIHQIYYLGVLDPTGQLPEAFYRITVRGQASAISGVDFQSGWVPAAFVDSLGSSIQFQSATTGSDPGLPKFSEVVQKSDEKDGIKVGRRLVLFGPEGFRYAPKNHRLTILMGSDASKFFQAVDTALGEVAEAKEFESSHGIRSAIHEALAELARDAETASDVELSAERRLNTAGGKQ